jgi:hypothetical protein
MEQSRARGEYQGRLNAVTRVETRSARKEKY